MWDVDSEGGSPCVGAKDIWGISVLSPQFCCKPKSTLKNEVCVKSIVRSCVSNKMRDGGYCSTKPHIKESSVMAINILRGTIYDTRNKG